MARVTDDYERRLGVKLAGDTKGEAATRNVCLECSEVPEDCEPGSQGSPVVRFYGKRGAMDSRAVGVADSTPETTLGKLPTGRRRRSFKSNTAACFSSPGSAAPAPRAFHFWHSAGRGRLFVLAARSRDRAPVGRLSAPETPSTAHCRAGRLLRATGDCDGKDTTPQSAVRFGSARLWTLAYPAVRAVAPGSMLPRGTWMGGVDGDTDGMVMAMEASRVNWLRPPKGKIGCANHLNRCGHFNGPEQVRLLPHPHTGRRVPTGTTAISGTGLCRSLLAPNRCNAVRFFQSAYTGRRRTARGRLCGFRRVDRRSPKTNGVNRQGNPARRPVFTLRPRRWPPAGGHVFTCVPGAAGPLARRRGPGSFYLAIREETMLCLTLKEDGSAWIGEGIQVVVLSARHGVARLGFVAPAEFKILRDEVRRREEQRKEASHG